MSKYVVIQTNFKPAFGYEGLSELFERAIPTLQADKSRSPEKLPPACHPPGFKSPIFLLSDCLDWLAQYREPTQSKDQSINNESIPPKKRGRPPKSLKINNGGAK